MTNDRNNVVWQREEKVRKRDKCASRRNISRIKNKQKSKINELGTTTQIIGNSIAYRKELQNICTLHKRCLIKNESPFYERQLVAQTLLADPQNL